MKRDKISIIIVTFNVSKFITFCIDSIYRSIFSGDIQIIVVDNNSSDNSVRLISEEYSEILIIKNDSNLGFAKACNQGAQISDGTFCLFLNPDCIISENTLQKMYDSFVNDEVGSVGPLLIDGRGQVLPESARELPTTKSALTKLFKLPFEKSFPYYRKVDTQEPLIAPILCGACMLMRSEVFEKLNGFDERFFMYGEDIDLSLRLVQSNYNNFCIPKAQVIHFKGESTDKGIMKNNSNFYNAISLYAEKHSESFGTSYRKVGLNALSKVLPIVRYLREYVKRAIPLMLDFTLIIVLFFVIQFIWSFYKYGNIHYFGIFKYFHFYLGYTLIWLVTLVYQGVYFSNNKIVSVYKGTLIGGVINLVLFALLPVEWRFSRAVLLLSSLVIPILISLKYAVAKHLSNLETIFATKGDVHQIDSSISGYNIDRKMDIDSVGGKDKSRHYIIDYNNLEIEKIIQLMRASGPFSKFEFYDSERNVVFSSDGQNSKGEGINVDAFMNLSKKKYLLQKRTLDVILGLMMVVPLSIVKVIFGRLDFTKLSWLLQGRLTSVGFGEYNIIDNRLPAIPQSILNCYTESTSEEGGKERCLDYAFNYSIFDDLLVIGMNLSSFIRAFI